MSRETDSVLYMPACFFQFNEHQYLQLRVCYGYRIMQTANWSLLFRLFHLLLLHLPAARPDESRTLSGNAVLLLQLGPFLHLSPDLTGD